MATDEPSTSTSPSKPAASEERAAASAPVGGAASEDAAGAGPAGAGREKEAGKPRKRRRWLRVLVIVVVALVLVAGALVGAFAWDRWYRYDDAADIQGAWYPAGSTTAIEIDADKISFDGETSYDYTLDTHEKTISFTLGPLQGTGRYWFANDRSALVIEDGEGFTARDTALADFGRAASGVADAISGTGQRLPEGDGFSVFTREPDPEVVAAKAEAARQAKEEEEARRKAEEDAARAAEEAAARAAKAAEEAAARAARAAEAEAAAEGADATEAQTDAQGAASGSAEEEPDEFANESMGIFE